MDKNKKTIKAFAAFLLFMWICTIVSRSIYVSKLTRVSCDTPSEKYIEHNVRAEGMVYAEDKCAVTALSELRIKRIYVKKGDKVEKGDLLFDIDMTDLDKLISQKEIQLTTKQYQLADIQFNNVLSAQKKEIESLWAKEDYENAVKETQVKITRAEEKLTLANQKLGKHLQTAAPYTPDEERKKAWDKYHQYKNDYYDILDKISELEARISELERKIEQEQQTDTQSDKDSENGENSENKKDIESMKRELEAAKEELSKAKQTLNEYERNPVSQPDYSAEESEYDIWQSTRASLEAEVKAAEYALADEKAAAEETLRAKLRAQAAADTLSTSDSTVHIYELEIADIQSQLDEYYNIREKKGCMEAQNSGYVLDIAIAVGGRTTDTAVMTLSINDTPCRFEFTADKEMAKYIHTGDSVEISINGTNASSKEIEAVVTYMTRNNQGGYDVSCELPSDMGEPNMTGTAVRTVQGELYSICIPVDAIHMENEAAFVYILEEKDGILGKEYCVQKVKVNVLDKNDRFAAIEGGVVSKDSRIITYSSKELKQGESVRL